MRLLAGLVAVALAAPALAVPKPKTVVQPSATNPLVAIRIYFKVGAADDPKGKEGLAALTAAMLGRGGTKKRAYADVLDALYPLAARINFYGDKESTVFLGTVHRDNLASYADLIAEQILEPRFSEEDFRRNRQDALDYLSKTLRGNDDEALGKQALGTVLWKEHPYRHPTPGTVAGLEAITLDDVKAFYARTFTVDRLIVGVGGGLPPGFADTFAARFAALPAKSPPPVRLPAPATRKGAELVLVDKDAPANAISIGHPIRLTRADADFYPLTVARSYLGEHRTFNGVLMNELRGKRGLNYGDYAYIENFIEDPGTTFARPNIARRQQHFEIWIRPVQPQNTLFALRAALYHTEKLVREGIPEKGFEETRQFLLNYSNLWAQDASRRLGHAIDAAVTGKDLIKELQSRLPRMRKADVDRAIRKHIKPGDFAAAIVSAGAADLKVQLAAAAPSPMVYDTKGTAPEVLAEDELIAKQPLPIRAEAITVVPVGEMFEK